MSSVLTAAQVRGRGYANRLAHLTFLREQGVKAWLVFVYFYGDSEMSGPMSPEEWTNRLGAVHKHLGYEGDLSSRGVVNVFIPVDALETSVV
jgi:hypothetical protein